MTISASLALDPEVNSYQPISQFKPGVWSKEINVRDFIQTNFTSYNGDEGFLVGSTAATEELWGQVVHLLAEERRRGVLDAETSVPSSVTAFGPGYLNRDLEKVVGFQTDSPLKRGIYPFGGIRMVQAALEAFGFALDPATDRVFTSVRKTHNEGVFDAYTPEILACRKSGIITGLPDAYGRGRIIGDYRRVPLYGVDTLITDKRAQKDALNTAEMSEDTIRLREELSDQIRALSDLKEMAARYGFDISRPAQNGQEAIQWLYFAYLGAVKEQDGAAMSLGRVSTFLDIYFERDLAEGVLSEEEVQELVDHFIMKLRLVRFLRTPEYNELFSGDPTWVTECIGGLSEKGIHLVTKTSFRFLNTLFNLGPAPEPNLTVLWSPQLPEAFKRFCAKVSEATSSLQYENDDLMRPRFGDDYGIACCVSAMQIGKQMQFFGARANLAKLLLYAINGGRDEKSGQVVGLEQPLLVDEVLDFDEIWERFTQQMGWLAKTYISALNIIHFMHDKYAYERLQMALHDRDVERTMACGVAGLSVVADSLAAIRYAKVRMHRNREGIADEFSVEGEYPQYGNNDQRVDALASKVITTFMDLLRKHRTYRGAKPTQSVLTITSNVVYGKKTGSTPDGRRGGDPFAPGANPMHGRDRSGLLASLCSVAQLPYADALDGISNTASILPEALGKGAAERHTNLVQLLDGYMDKGGHHLNINVLRRETLLDAMENPEKYPQLTIRVSGYAVNFVKLTREQQEDVIARTFHGRC